MKVPSFAKPSPKECARRFRPWHFRFAIFITTIFSFAQQASADDTIKAKVVDDENHSVTETISDAHGKLQKKTVFYFDDNNWSKGAVHYTTADTIRYKETFLRDNKGQMLETWLYSKDDKVLGHRVFHYTGDNKLERIDDYDAAGKLLPPQAVSATPASPGRPDKKKR